MTEALEQGTEAWRLARCGSLGASRIADAVARTKTGYGASRANLMAELLIERLTGAPTEGYMNAAMQHGVNTEPEARDAYAFHADAEVQQVGLIRHPSIVGTHASPDGLIGEDGMCEIKCPNTATHIDTLLTDNLPDKYIKQMQWQMACSGRAWVDFISYDNRVPPSMRLFVKRIARDDKMIREIEIEVKNFLAELALMESTLRNKFDLAEAA